MAVWSGFGFYADCGDYPVYSSEYEPPVMSRVHAGDGKLIYEFSKQARVFVPVNTIPRELQLAFVSAEDQRFYTHNGWDPIGLTRAALSAPMKKIKNQRIGGTSTLTQQVAKNFLSISTKSISDAGPMVSRRRP